jgi:hypothetical protein
LALSIPHNYLLLHVLHSNLQALDQLITRLLGRAVRAAELGFTLKLLLLLLLVTFLLAGPSRGSIFFRSVTTVIVARVQ